MVTELGQKLGNLVLAICPRAELYSLSAFNMCTCFPLSDLRRWDFRNNAAQPAGDYFGGIFNKKGLDMPGQ